MAEAQKQDGVIQIVVFQLGNELYGADIGTVREVGPLQRMTRVPRTPRFVKGVTNLRGRVIPVVDLRRRLNLPESEATKSTRIAVAELEGGQVGMVVDAVLEVLRVPLADIEPPALMVTKLESDYVTGVAKVGGRLIILLDLGRVLVRDERRVV